MIKFNDIRINNNISEVPYLIIDASVLSMNDYFDNVYITKVIIVDANTYKDNTDPSNVDTSTTVLYTKTYDESLKMKNINLMLKGGDLDSYDLNSGILGVFVYTNGKVSDCVPCSLATNYDMSIVYNTCNVASVLLEDLNKFVEERNKCDVIPNVDRYLMYKHMCLSFCLGNYEDGVKDYNILMNSVSKHRNKNCNCRR